MSATMNWPQLCTTRLLDQNFGMAISPQDILVPYFNNQGTNYYRPWRLCEELANKDYGSTVDNSKDKFVVQLDVQHFLPNEVSVKVNENEVIIEAKHEDKKDDHGFVSRRFVRRYALPRDCVPESVTSTLSSDGVLTVTAKKQINKQVDNMKNIPIKILTSSHAREQLCKEMKNDKCETNDNEQKLCKEEIKSEKCETKNMKAEKMSEECRTACNIAAINDMKIDSEIRNGKFEKSQITMETCEMKMNADKAINDGQVILKEEHSRLLKPELLGEAVSTTDKLLSESRKETDELLKLISVDKAALSGTTGMLDEALGQCKTAINELKKEKLTESSIMEMSESSSSQSSMMSETIEMSMSSSTKASTSQKISNFNEIRSSSITAELLEAAENIIN